uniref:Type 2 C1q domain-containing protein n=1 Tax=Testudinalia testudinalis TaxID=2126142 RepID=A0A411DEU4_TESTE|nr:type 2 C1q domain-containing protein [Testudinalia testudinalis]
MTDKTTAVVKGLMHLLHFISKTTISGNMLALLTVCFIGGTTAMWPAFPFQLIPSAQLTPGLSPTHHQPREPLQAESVSESVRTCLCQNEIQILDARLRSEHTLLEKFHTKLTDLSNVVYNLRATVIEKDIPKRETAEQAFGPGFGQHVAFTARTRTNKVFLGPTDTVVFDEATVNNGHAYDPLTGVFTAPFNGVYHFSSTILSGFNATIETMFVLNGEEVGRMFSGAFLSRGSGSNSILLNLKERDEVSVNVFYGNGNYVHGGWSTFMGYLISTIY